MELVKIGNYSFNIEFLREVTIDKAIETLCHVPSHIVVRAWNEANPTAKEKTQKVKKAVKTVKKA